MCLLGNGTTTLVSSGVAVVKKLFLFSSLPVFGAYSLQILWTTTYSSLAESTESLSGDSASFMRRKVLFFPFFFLPQSLHYSVLFFYEC